MQEIATLCIPLDIGVQMLFRGERYTDIHKTDSATPSDWLNERRLMSGVNVTLEMGQGVGGVSGPLTVR